MTLHTQRLIALIEFAKQTTQLKNIPLQNISQHKDLNRLEERISGLPGVTLNDSDSEYGEVWFRLDRLHESEPPKPENKLLETWMELSRDPNKEPSLKSHVVRKVLIDIGALSVENSVCTLDDSEGITELFPNPNDKFFGDNFTDLSPCGIHGLKINEEPILLALEDYSDKELLSNQIKSYIEVVWKSWAEKEKEIRKSIKFYIELFTLFQGNLRDSQLELVWGVGVAVWVTPAGNITYPLLTQLVEISLNEHTMAIEIRPRQTEPRLEVDIYSSMGNLGVAELVATSKRFFKELDSNLNPFEPSTFELLLQSAATLLDASGVYWPTQTSADDRKLPKPTESLVLTDTWILLARPRTNNLLVQDFEQFELLLSEEDLDSLPSAVKALVTEPSSIIQEVNYPPYRGLSIVDGSPELMQLGGKVADLYFPKVYNDEQVKIIQMLAAHDGVVVQGPPGTGKTHTIANVICHYLALGKRVLVTSMKDPALSVLRDKLPDSIRPLTISLLSSEAEGMKQFEHSINKISSEVTRIDRIAYLREIEQIDGEIDSLHERISKTDKNIAMWARLNIEEVKLDNETLKPVDVAVEIVRQRNDIEWFPDTLSIESKHRTQFVNDDICALRDARAELGIDLAYLGKRLPLIASFPETEKLLQVHQDLSKLSDLKEQASKSKIPSLINTKQETIQVATYVASKVATLRRLLQEIENANQAWAVSLKKYLRRNNKSQILELFNTLAVEILATSDKRKQFLVRPVELPEALESNQTLIDAIKSLANGKKPFGFFGGFGKSEQKKQLDNITVIGVRPSSEDDWKHALDFFHFKQHCKALLVRWNALADEILIPRLEIKPEHLQSARKTIDLYEKITKSLAEEKEIIASIKQLLPSWLAVSEMTHPQTLGEVEFILQHHLTRQRLSETWLVKESFENALFGCEGDITSQISLFFNHSLGNPTYNDSQIQDDWSKLLKELRRIHGKISYLDVVNSVTLLIENSGASSWAEKLRTEFYLAPTDKLLPDNWRAVWRLCRLMNFVDQIDGRDELKKLSALRTELENDLSNRYQEAVNKRTWLKLAENATPDVRSALEAYRAAIMKIGKGTGRRAGRYRHDAQVAANRANSAIPCWIMPHYRICESLPPTLGSFDLVIIDEASQSDLTALPAILRAKKVLIVGDDKQVSPDGVGLEEEKIKNLMNRFLAHQVDTFRPQMSPDRSIYDLFKTVFASSSVMLREHFRCAGPIIEYSKREFYNHDLKPLRIPKASERLDPPLVDVYIANGHRNKENVNLPEAQFIIDEIKSIVSNPAFDGRTIGVVSLLGNKQAYKVMQMLNDELGEQIITRYKIECGDARAFQGKERDIMFLTMVASFGNARAQTKDTDAQRFNVAASRARDRMYLVRSIELEELSQKDYLRSKLIQHFQVPFLQSEDEIKNSRDLCESPFEREVFDVLVERGYRVTPQVSVGAYRIDMIVEGDSDARLAIECDGDRYHGPDQWDSDIRRQRILERAGWHFWRCFASTFVLHKQDVIHELIEKLTSFDIHPSSLERKSTSIHVERREI